MCAAELARRCFMQQVLSQGQILLLQQYSVQDGRHIPKTDRDRASVGVLCGLAVARLDLQQLVGTAHALVVNSRVASSPRLPPSNLHRLWVLHNWLLQHELLDGRGLGGVLSEQQLQQGGLGADQFGDK